MTRKSEDKINWRAHVTIEEETFIRDAELAKAAAAKAQSVFNSEFGSRYRQIRNDAIGRAKAMGRQR